VVSSSVDVEPTTSSAVRTSTIHRNAIVQPVTQTIRSRDGFVSQKPRVGVAESHVTSLFVGLEERSHHSSLLISPHLTSFRLN